MESKQNPLVSLSSLDKLLERDKQREKDGFPRKIRVGKFVKPVKNGKNKVVVVPTTTEEKFYHDSSPQNENEEESSSGGSGKGKEGDVVGKEPVHRSSGEGEGGSGQGQGGEHEIESSAYDLGKILTEKFELPNLKNKGKKKSLTKFTYDLTDRNRGFGQVLDKKATLRKIVKTNLALKRIPDIYNINPEDFIISPQDKIYRILSKEKDFESQAIVFFMRDYSGSMSGKPTEIVVGQHILIYSWLLYQFDKQVESRFILHDTEAKEVKDFHTYYNSMVAGGTQVESAFKLVNDIIEKESLAKDYNIYIFHGTDGDDWDSDGVKTLPQIKKALSYANRVGITIANNGFGSTGNSDMEKYLKKSGLLEKKSDLIRLDSIPGDADEKRLIDGIKSLISE